MATTLAEHNNTTKIMELAKTRLNERALEHKDMMGNGYLPLWLIADEIIVVLILIILCQSSLYCAATETRVKEMRFPIVVGDIQYVIIDPLTGMIKHFNLPSPAGDMAIFRDGRRFICTNLQWSDNGGLVFGKLVNGKPHVIQLTKNDDLSPIPSWSQRKIAFSRNHELTVMNISTMKIRIVAQIAPIFHNLSPFYHIGWSDCCWTLNDHDLLCTYYDPVNREHPGDLWVIHMNRGYKREKLLKNASSPCVNPIDGTIVYLREKKRRSGLEIWVGRLSKFNKLTDTRQIPIEVDSNVIWSPDGRSLTYLHWVSSDLGREVCTYTLSTRLTKRVAGPSKLIQGYITW